MSGKKIDINNKNKREKRSLLLCGWAAIVIMLACILPLPSDLTREGMISISLILAGIIMWAGDVMPMGITAILLSVLMPWFGIIDFADYYPNFATSILFFMLATFVFTAALSTSTVPARIVNIVLKLSKGKTGVFIFGIMLGCGILSAVMSNIPTCLLFLGLILPLLKSENMVPGVSRFAKCIMLGIPAASALGGFMAPSGSPINLFAIQFIEEMTGISISYLGWMIFGVPIGLLSILIVFICYYIYFKPEKISKEGIEAVKKSVEEAGPLETRDKKALLLIIAILVAWIASTWIPILNTTIVALVGMTLFFVPGIRILTFKQYVDNISFDVLFMIGGVNVIAKGVVSSGAAQWIVDALLGNASQWPTLLVLLMMSVIGCLLHNLVPAGPAVVALALPPIITVAMSAGVSPVVCATIIAWWSSITFFLPFDALPLITYSAGYYSMGDMVKSGIAPTAVFIIGLAALGPVMSILGY